MSKPVNNDSKPVAVLSFEALEGTRCLESLVLLLPLGRRIHDLEGKPPKSSFYPHEYFSFCGGSGSGAILALMFGVYGMPVNYAIIRYQTAYRLLIPDDVNAKLNPQFSADDVQAAIVMIEDKVRRPFLSEKAPIPTVIFSRLWKDQKLQLFETYHPLPQQLDISEILLTLLARNHQLGVMNLKGVKYNDMTFSNTHVNTVEHAKHHFASCQKIAMHVAFGGRDIWSSNPLQLATHTPILKGIKSRSLRHQLLTLSLRARAPTDKNATTDLERSKPTSLRHKLSTLSLHAHAPIKQATTEEEVTFGACYHFQFSVNKYSIPGTNYADTNRVYDVLDRYLEIFENNRQLDECARAVFGLKQQAVRGGRERTDAGFGY
jgi:hypothetical protein